MNSDGRIILAQLEAHDDQYARNDWLSESIAWDNAGVYRRLADLIALKDDDLHVDLGCGLGTLALELRERFNQSILWAVDRNLSMIRMAEVLAQHFNFRYEIHAQVGLRTTEDRRAVEAIFVPDQSRIRKMHSFQPGGPIQFIVDDLRQMSVVKTILGERKIDSCSFVFPGYGARSVYEAPFPIVNQPSDVECKRRMGQYVDLVRTAAYRFASSRVKEGGQFFIVDRSPIADRARALKTLTNLLGPYGKYWEATDGYELGSMVRPDGRPYVARMPDGAVVESLIAHGYGFKLIRNRLPFEE